MHTHCPMMDGGLYIEHPWWPRSAAVKRSRIERSEGNPTEGTASKVHPTLLELRRVQQWRLTVQHVSAAARVHCENNLASPKQRGATRPHGGPLRRLRTWQEASVVQASSHFCCGLRYESDSAVVVLQRLTHHRVASSSAGLLRLRRSAGAFRPCMPGQNDTAASLRHRTPGTAHLRLRTRIEVREGRHTVQRHASRRIN